MINGTLGHTINLSSLQSHAPAEVYLLTMGKETLVKSPHHTIVGSTHQHTGTCGPHHLRNRVILPLIILNITEYPATTEGITVTIEIATTGSCIFKGRMITLRKQFGLAGGNIGMTVHKLHQRLQPMGRYLHIRIEQHIIFCLYLGQGTVVSTSKSPITV